MKLKTRLYLLAALPVLLLTIVLTSIANYELAQAVFNTNYAGMQATATALRDLFQSQASGDSSDAVALDSDGQTLASLDYMKEQTGYDITFFKGDTRYLTTITNNSGERQSGTKAGAEVISTVLEQGLDYKNDNIDILGTRYIGYYVPVYAEGSDTPMGMTFLGIPYKTVTGRILRNIRFIILPALLLLVLSMLFAWRMGSHMTGDIQTGIRYMQQLEQGQLGFSMDQRLLSRHDVIGDLCRSIASLNNKLTAIVQDVKQQCSTLDDNSSTASKTAGNLSDSFTQISAIVEEIAATTTSQAEDAERANQNILSMENLIEHISTESNSAMGAINDLSSGMKQVEQAVAVISDQTNLTCSSVEKIDSAAELISSISLQTRLLSLNASIEAARAGVYGKGFAVVAAEIQQLAHESEESTKEIQTVLDELKSNSEKSLKGTKDVMETVGTLGERLRTTEQVVTTLLREIGLDDADAEPANSSDHSLHSEQLRTITAVNNLAASAEEIAASMEQTSATVESVATLAETMGTQAESLRRISDVLTEDLKYFDIT